MFGFLRFKKKRTKNVKKYDKPSGKGSGKDGHQSKSKKKDDLLYPEDSDEENLKNKKDWTIHEACEYGNIDIVIFLAEEEKVDLEKKTADTKENALHLACWNGKEKIVKYLLRQHLDMDEPDADGNTPLHLSSFKGNYQICKYLVLKGCALDPKNKVGNCTTPLYYAAKFGFREIALLLLYFGAKKEIANNTETLEDICKTGDLLDLFESSDKELSAEFKRMIRKDMKNELKREWDEIEKDYKRKEEEYKEELEHELKKLKDDLDLSKLEIQEKLTKKFKKLMDNVEGYRKDMKRERKLLDKEDKVESARMKRAMKKREKLKKEYEDEISEESEFSDEQQTKNIKGGKRGKKKRSQQHSFDGYSDEDDKEPVNKRRGGKKSKSKSKPKPKPKRGGKKSKKDDYFSSDDDDYDKPKSNRGKKKRLKY